jgi:hypothetical protein
LLVVADEDIAADLDAGDPAEERADPRGVIEVHLPGHPVRGENILPGFISRGD